MHKELLMHSPLLALPIFAMFVFLAVFVLTSMRAMRARAPEVQRAARLPFDEET